MLHGAPSTSPGSLTSNGVALSARSSGCKSRLGHERGVRWCKSNRRLDRRSSAVEQPRFGPVVGISRHAELKPPCSKERPGASPGGTIKPLWPKQQRCRVDADVRLCYFLAMAERANITKAQLEAAVAASDTMSGTIRALGLTISGGTYATMKSRIKRWSLDTSHWLGQAHARGRAPHNKGRQKPLSEILIDGSSYGSDRLKRRLVEEELLEDKCSECEQLPWWNGKPLVLELDHINGNRRDNRLANLRILCGHCHSQTPTFRGKNKKIGRRIYKCCDCGKQISKGATRCNPCDKRSRPRRSN